MNTWDADPYRQEDSAGNECNYLNHYRCDHEDSLEEGQPTAVWEDRWSCACNDRCPVCGHEIQPYESEDLNEMEEEDEYA